MKLIVIQLFAVLLLTACSGSTPYNHITSDGPTLSKNWIDNNVFAINDKGRDFSDLHFLKEQITDKRIIALGEQTHYDGKTFEIRARLIEYLVEEEGFDVILFESGMFDIYYAQTLINKSRNIGDLKGALYPFWRKPIQHNRLFDFLQARLNSKQSIEFAGFDTKLTSRFSREEGNYSVALKSVLSSIDSDILLQPEAVEYFSVWSEIEADMADGGIGSIGFDMEEPEKKRLLSLSGWIQSKLSGHNEYWKQMVNTVDKSVVLYSEVGIFKAIFDQDYLIDYVNNTRDVYMAENLEYLLSEIYPNRKVILVGATYHFLRDNEYIIPNVNAQVPFEKSKIMTNLLSQRLQDELYVIGFASAYGEYGEANIGEQGDEIPEPFDFSLEAELANQDIAYAFIPLNKTTTEPFWQMGPHLTLFDYELGVASKQWHNIIDAVIYIDKMEPLYFSAEGE